MDFLTGENVSIMLFFIGIAGIFSSRRILKSIVCIGITEVSVVMFYLTMFADTDDIAPIATNTTQNVADPLPQALMITAIVIGVGITAIALVMFINLYHMYGTSDWEQLRKKRMEQL